ncbi:MAG: hypothetical protein H0Z18_04465 [Thermococcus sp.]|uniref:hypothetical protein n=1 Tax=Thermococcus sp. TaxID=35749 RepID=UPI001E0982D5|nr:hypothetical protein [Thermococcus sp.]MBO8174491.1 hypothetical protein [Thermococcus sp.]
MESILVQVMRPIFKPEDQNRAKFILYPYRIYHIKLLYKRLKMSDRVVDYFAYVDCYRFGVERGDGIIEIQEWKVPKDVIMSPNITEEEARQKAVESAFNWGNLMVISWWTPKIEVVQEVEVYKVFWIFEKEGEVYVMDSLTGDKFKLKDLI